MTPTSQNAAISPTLTDHLTREETKCLLRERTVIYAAAKIAEDRIKERHRRGLVQKFAAWRRQLPA